MKVIRTNLARSIWWLDTAELNPNGASIDHLIPGLAEEYGFHDFPEPGGWYRKEGGLKFLGGSFNVDGVEVEIALEIFRDGIMAECRRSTSACDEFLSDLFEWLASQLNVTYPSDLVRTKSYRSEVILSASHGLAGLCAKLDEFAGTASKELGQDRELTAITFGSGSNVSEFTFERRVNEPFELNRFFSAATLQTESHLAVLKRFVKMIQ